MKINIEIVKKAIVSNPKKIENLNEKILVPNMMLRRRLSRSSKILINLADSCEFKNGIMVYGSAYGEIQDTSSILYAIKNNDTVNPSAFQNSVYNTPASYHSILQKNADEIVTLSCGDNTSYNVMQQGALMSLKTSQVFICAIEAVNFKEIDILNTCNIDLEYGIAFVIKKTDKKPNIKVQSTAQLGVPNSLHWMKNLYDISNPDSIIEVTL